MRATTKRGLALLVTLMLALAVVPGLAAAETRTGGTITVGAGETIDDDLEAFGGTVVVHGTVNGDLQALGGNVVVDGTVTGDVYAAAGNVQIDGEIGGSVDAAAGNVEIGPDARIGGDLEAAAGNVLVLGTVGGNAALAGESVRLGPTAEIGGSVEYDAEEFVRDEGAAVAGTVTRNPELGEEIGPGVGGMEVPTAPGGAFAVYGFLANLLLGAVLLLAFPGFSERVSRRAAESPLRTGGVGLLAVVGVPVVLVLVAITIIGVPLSLVGALAFAVAAWVGAVYGRYAVGAWLLSYTAYDNRWAALLAGFVVVAVAVRIPFLGWLVSAAVFVLGLGALAAELYDAYRRRSGPGAEPGAEPSEGSGARPA